MSPDTTNSAPMANGLPDKMSAAMDYTDQHASDAVRHEQSPGHNPTSEQPFHSWFPNTALQNAENGASGGSLTQHSSQHPPNIQTFQDHMSNAQPQFRRHTSAQSHQSATQLDSAHNMTNHQFGPAPAASSNANANSANNSNDQAGTDPQVCSMPLSYSAVTLALRLKHDLTFLAFLIDYIQHC